MDDRRRSERAVDRAVEWVAWLVVERSRTVVVAFLLLTGVFALGAGQVGTETGTSQFTEDVPAQRALDRVENEFERPGFELREGQTQLIQTGQNVLSRQSLLRMVRAQRRVAERDDLRVVDSASVARLVAREIDPTATGLAAEERALEDAAPTAIDRAVRHVLATTPSARDRVSTDYNARSASASATVGTIRHAVGGEDSSGPPTGTSELTVVQQRTAVVVDTVGADITVFGDGIVSAEFDRVIVDSLRLVVPAAVVLVLLFLAVAYRDVGDLLLGGVGLAIAVVCTFGFMGLAGIAFTQVLIAVPPLLLAVGIDFGIHVVNRYREARANGAAPAPAMREATGQLVVAFGIVTGTTVVGFGANVTSSLPPIRELGVVAGVGIVFTFLVFGVLLPAAKSIVDRRRVEWGVDRDPAPLGSEASLLGRVLPAGVAAARAAPRVVLLVAVVGTVAMGWYGAGVGSEFEQEDFLPPEEPPDYLQYVPGPLRPGEYTTARTTALIEDRFETASGSTATVLVDAPLRSDTTLEQLWRVGDDPPPSFVAEDGHAVEASIVTVVRSYAERDPGFARLVARNDRNDNGIPDENVEQVLAALFDSPFGDRARQYATEDLDRTRIVYAVEPDAPQGAVAADARQVADRTRYEATATGDIVVFQAVSDQIRQSTATSLALALVAATVFLILVYAALEGRPSLGLVNALPIAVTVAAIAATMRAFGIPFNALTGTVLSIGIGLGIDYSAHVVHRFADEYGDGTDVFVALDHTVRGTGGALTGSMLTTVGGVGVLVLAVTPILGDFGLLTGISIFYSYLSSLLILPSAVVVWERRVAAD